MWLHALVLVTSQFSAALGVVTLPPPPPYNFTYSMAQRCKEHISSNGYHYSPFYRIQPSVRPDGSLLDMHIAVLATSNGHILLSSVERPALSDAVYEIVLGGGANKFSELRRLQKRATKVSVRTVGILSAVHFRAFWIRLSDDGSVDVGREGDTLPFLHYNDADPLSINYFSFASWAGVEAMFLYDCPIAGNDTYENATRSETMAPRLTTAQRLKVALLGERSPLTPPSPQLTVRLALNVAAVSYNARDSVLHTLLGVVMRWEEPTLVWNPDLYNGTTSLRLQQVDIWKPQLYVHNSVNIGELSPKTTEPIYVLNSGAAVLHLRTEVRSYCEDPVGGAAWPRDHYTCWLYLAPWEQHEQISLQVLENNDAETVENTQENGLVTNEWELVQAGYALGDSDLSPYSNVTCARAGDADLKRLLVVVLKIKRRGAYTVALYTPLLAIMLLLLMSFWGQLSRRRELYSVACVSLCALLCISDTLPPAHTLPTILILYDVVLASCVLALFVQLALTYPPLAARYASPLHQIISTQPLAALCCLPPNKTYARFSEDDDAETLDSCELPSSSAPGGGTTPAATPSLLRMHTSPPPRRPTPQEQVAMAVDRIMFTFYFILYSVMLACHY